MKFAAAPRREIGIRTVFNILGPLTNPAGATTHLLGVSDPTLGPRMAEGLALLGSYRALVVHGKDGLDEVTTGDSTIVWELNEGSVSEYEVTPEDLGVERASTEEIQVSSADESAEMARGVLDGELGPARDVVLMNAGAALVAAGAAESLADGVARAAESIDSGAAHGRMAALVELSQRLE